MKELVFALQFKGKAHPVEGVEGKLAAKTTAAGQVLRTVLTAKGVQAKAESRPGPRATFESEVQKTGAGTFIESGRISYGKAGGVTFKTAGHGVLGASGVDGLQRGAVIWEVTDSSQGPRGSLPPTSRSGPRARSWTITTFAYSCPREGSLDGVGSQPRDRQGTRPDDPAIAPAPGGPGDRVEG